MRFRLQVQQYVFVTCLTLCVWDWLIAVSDEVEMIRQGERRLRYLWNGVYIIARICPIVYLIVTLIISIGPIISIYTCGVITRFVAAANMLLMPAATSLFCIRLSAVYSRDKYITIFFGSCWLMILSLFIFDSAKTLFRLPRVIQSTECLIVEHYDAWGYMATAVYDTLMYFAISWRLASFAMLESWHHRVRSFATGYGLGWLSKVLLQSGQAYYFLTIGFNICTVVFIYNPSVPLGWQSLFLGPTITFTSVMACRLFRELKLGLFADPMAEKAISKIVCKDIGTITQYHSAHAYELRTFDGTDEDTGDTDRRVASDTGNISHRNV
ncbi:hypothetical protein PILCRDRAFT_817773 [Piloderma croceum F 1598]|uniref:Uncharacterized protein n=1 Tax=Piloderma croceum (strain F 1598) TaxID=765440 RepID=A0A0C3FLL0_PILCF|nr:hypothetical protein PILCRDRAFT_817773 [Piloderma croceum F 1598]